MKIIILDGYTLNPGDLSWQGLEDLGELTVYDRTPEDKILHRSRDADILLTNKTPLTADTISGLPQLKYIGVLAMGYNVVDTEAARQRNIPVTNAAGYGTFSVAQLSFALILELCHRVQQHSDSVMQGQWASSPDFCYWNAPLVELQGKTLGIIGYGSIGQRVAAIGSAFGMKIMVSDRSASATSRQEGLHLAEVDELLSQADIVSIHCPLTEETRGMINRRSLQRMKPTAFLINTARGPIVVEDDLADALRNGVIAAAGLDVLNTEPPAADNPLYKLPNCLITPHIAWATLEARQRLMEIVVENLKGFLEGKEVNVVN